jgi:DNA (cytosine-5)-methyltransferase 1
VAGKRAGLEGERSGLFRTAIKLVYGLRARTRKPRYFVWENVPGAFSSNKGNDFRAVLEEITKTEIPMPKDGRWAESGCVEWGGTSSLAWRTLDSQYWGVPQRRKRIFLVADFDGRSAAEILFVEQGLHGDSAEIEREGQEVATDVGTSINSASGIGYQNCAVLRMRSGCAGGGKGPLISKNKSLTLATNNDQTLFTHGVIYSMGHDERSAQFTPNKTDPLTASDYKQPPIVGEPKIAGTLTATFYKGAGNNSVDACLWPDSKANTVRRLVPLECERLMGLPDSWTDVEFNGKPAPDSKRYKAIGNGMAVPCSDFIMRRIAEVSNGQNEGHD